jgi:RNA polymerase sigma factor (sigma-70 family)
VTADLISRARAGDGEAFRALTEPYRRELQVHCYRMLGSFQDAEDAVQDTLAAAWQGLAGFEGRASIRTWLYRIATNRCRNALRSASRRPAKAWDISEYEPPEPTRLGEVVWLEPYPDALLEGAIDVPLGPEARYEQTEAISLAFVTALQVRRIEEARRTGRSQSVAEVYSGRSRRVAAVCLDAAVLRHVAEVETRHPELSRHAEDLPKEGTIED